MQHEPTPAAKRARVEAFVDATPKVPEQSITHLVDEVAAPARNRVRAEAPVDDAALLCDETLVDTDDEETVLDGLEAGYESPEPTPLSPRAITSLLGAPEKKRP